MSIHIMTGNAIDVVYEYEGDRAVFKGIKPRGKELIPVRDPEALAQGIMLALDDIRKHNVSRVFPSVEIIEKEEAR